MAAARTRRSWLELVLQARSSIRIAGVSSTFPFLRSLMNENRVDAVVVDLQSVADLDTAREWVIDLLDVVPVILLSPLPDNAIFNRLVRGTSGAILRTDATADQILHAIEIVSTGLMVFDKSLVPSSETGDDATEELTPRETEVLRLLAEGFGNREIAQRLDISEHTIKFHIRSILGKLGASSRTEAVTRGFRAGLIEL